MISPRIPVSILLCGFLFAGCTSDSPNNKKTIDENAFARLLPEVESIPVAFLGSYHMSNPGADQFNLEADDVLVPKRQEEIKEVIELLKAFKPTKIAVEAPYGGSTAINRYEAYLNDSLELRRSEEEQIGFRLAKSMGHSTIYPIDVKMNLNNDGIGKLVGANPEEFGPLMAGLEKSGKGAINILGEWLQNGTIREMLYKMNDPEVEEIALSLYFQYFVPIVEGEDYAGADMVNTWYHRNIQIFSNLHKIAEANDRILVVYGQGHIPPLKHFTEMSPYFEVEDVRQYLGE
ncbi:MAG: hypothetical protein HKN16_10200 [Saprospiraceae bacterium]|nr:hypothetical protein [Saprospiraceae bacterium]